MVNAMRPIVFVSCSSFCAQETHGSPEKGVRCHATAANKRRVT